MDELSLSDSWSADPNVRRHRLIAARQRQDEAILEILGRIPDDVIEAGSQYFFPGEFASWLVSFEPRLGRTPLQAVEAGRSNDVVGVITAIRNGIPI